MQYKNYLQAASLALTFLSLPAFAETKGVAHLGYEFGGDNILNANYTDGSSSSIDAGDGLVLAGGVAYLFNPQFSVQTTIGWKYQTIQQATNGSADFTRFPLEVMLQHTAGKVRLSGGITHHLSPKLSASGALSGQGISFEDATGTVFQLDYVTEVGMTWGIRYTNLTYTIENTNVEFDGGGLGIHIAGMF